MHFLGDYISARMHGCCTSNFYQSLQRTPKGDGGAPKKINREHLKSGLKFGVFELITSSLMGVSSVTKLFQATSREARVITLVQCLKGPPAKIWEGQKTFKKSERFLTTFDFDREYLQNGSTYRKSEKY